MSQNPGQPETLSTTVEAHRDALSDLLTAPDRAPSPSQPPPAPDFRADTLLSSCIDPNG
ncbi:hypothetical protein AB0N16_36155 [Streptomyces sp. NPDC051105]|uniref:hypothetical protein n=1 Tax=Streptomyces sp. NPDC051105 TaxID=3154843 RepID=UPI00342C878D